MSDSDKQKILNRIGAFFSQRKVYTYVWMVVSIASALLRMKDNAHNNFLIFRSSFPHLLEQLNLYALYPQEYYDIYLYGPIFGLLVAPFSVLPVPIGLTLWNFALALLLFKAISMLEKEENKRAAIYWISAHDLLMALFMQQFNVAICAFALLAFVAIESRREGWAGLFIALGTLTKLYGIVALAFFPFVRRKKSFVRYTLLWFIILLVLPLAVSSPGYLCGQYIEWINTLTQKNEWNMFSYAQNISLLGLIRKVTGNAFYSDLWIIAPMVILFVLPFVRRECYRSVRFRKLILAQTLLYVVLLSTGSETSSYITAMVGIGIWYVYGSELHSRRLSLALLVGSLIFTSFGNSDLMPSLIRDEWLRKYSMKALFPTLVALANTYSLMTSDFKKSKSNENSFGKEIS